MDIALDTLNLDLDVSQGDLILVEDLDAVRQFLSQKLRLFLGEWFLDESVGIPYLDSIFVKNPNQTIVESILKTAILETPGVLELTAFGLSLNTSTRQLTLSFTARCQDGTIDFSETVVAS